MPHLSTRRAGGRAVRPLVFSFALSSPPLGFECCAMRPGFECCARRPGFGCCTATFKVPFRVH
eukprot:3078941-Alexandrium_andersonii.AAC.1